MIIRVFLMRRRTRAGMSEVGSIPAAVLNKMKKILLKWAVVSMGI